VQAALPVVAIVLQGAGHHLHERAHVLAAAVMVVRAPEQPWTSKEAKPWPAAHGMP
jgi:hypothetical protein